MVLIALKVRSSWSTSMEMSGTLPESRPFHSAAAAPPSINRFVTARIPRWDFKRLKRRSKRKAPSRPADSVNGLHLPRHVIHQHVLTQPLRRSEVGFAAAHLRNLLHELHQPEV